MRTLTAVDLFAGPGGMTQGFKNAGFAVVGAVERDPVAGETYALNHPEVHLCVTDIRSVCADELRSALGLVWGELDLLGACPPCQGFSSVRTRNGRRAVEDERNDLVLEIARFVDSFGPKAVMMENVPGLVRDERLQGLQRHLQENGYDLGEGPKVLNAVEYGVPQNRRRLVLLASRVGRVSPAPPLAVRKTVRDLIGDLSRAGESGDPLHDLPERRSSSVMRRIRMTPKDGGGRLDLPEEEQLDCHRSFDGFKDVYGRMAWDRPAPTITGGCFNPSKGRFLHPEENRNITLREAALLQGFPSDYRFSLKRGKTAAAAMIGNALPPGFVEAQARPLAKRLSEESP